MATPRTPIAANEPANPDEAPAPDAATGAARASPGEAAERAEVHALLRRWVEALNQVAPVEVALHPEGVVERHGWSAERSGVVETFEGVAAVAAWIARNRGGCVFGCDPPERAPEGWTARYHFAWGDFVNGGVWRFSTRDGRIHRLAHLPQDVPEAWKRGVPEGKRVPGMTGPSPAPGSSGGRHG